MTRTRPQLSALDNPNLIKRLDKSKMLDILLGFPDQLKAALDISGAVNFKSRPGQFSNIVFAGMGGSAMGGDLVRCAVEDELPIPFAVNRDYLTPAFVGPKTLFFASSYSGNTEETISAYKDARRKKANIIALTTGGELAKLARNDGYSLIEIPAGMPPRCAIGYLFVPVLSVLCGIGLISDKQKDICEVIDVITRLRAAIVGPSVASGKNMAKSIAVDLEGRFCAIYGYSKNLGCAVTRWRNQLCENAKQLATSHYIPEMNHNEIMGFGHPKRVLRDTVVIFLNDSGDHPRVAYRESLTGRIIKDRVRKVIKVSSCGDGLLARICSLVYIGDFVSFYLSILNKEDPTPIEGIYRLKRELSKK